MHFIIASREDYLSINALKKVKTPIYQPSIQELLGLPEEEEENQEFMPGDSDETETKEEKSSDNLTFQQIRNEIIYAIQSLDDDELREYFMNSIKFIGDFYVKFNDKWREEPINWRMIKKG